MPRHEYVQDMRLLFQAFENSQVHLLRRRIQKACDEFIAEFNQLEHQFKHLHSAHSILYKMAPNRRLLIEKQIERLQKFIREMIGTMNQLQNAGQVEDARILFLFERQHLFKNILRRHLKDMVD